MGGLGNRTHNHGIASIMLYQLFNMYPNITVHNGINLPLILLSSSNCSNIVHTARLLLYRQLEISQPPHQLKVAALQSCKAVNCTVFL
jgi:ABC-type lipoprotein export system ATPase subunit